jgi:pimeloyl-ACP methyl ester carboxylesterase
VIESEVLSEKILDVADRKCRVVYNLGSGVPVVFLHGFSFTIDVWQRTGVTTALMEQRVPFLALDMPYGLKSECKPKTRDTEVNINVVHEAVQYVFGSVAPLLVGASLGGHIALQYATRFPVKSLLLVAPVRVFEGALAASVERFTSPVHIIIGSKDDIASLEELRDLAGRLADAKLTVREGVGHAAYRDSPDRFNRDLLELHAAVQK